MSYKYHTQQRKRKWAEQGTCFSSAFINQVAHLASDTQAPSGLQALAQELHKLCRVQFTFGEVEDLKHVLAVFQKQLDQGGFGDQLGVAVDLLLEILFAANSRPLHRTILAVFKKMQRPGQQDLIASLLQARILRAAQEYLQRQHQQQHQQSVPAAAHDNHQPEAALPARGSHSNTATAPVTVLHHAQVSRVVLGQTLASFLWLPNFLQWAGPVCVPAVHAVALSTQQVLEAAQHEQHVPPSLMTELQESISAMYALIQKYGEVMAGSDAGRAALMQAANTMLYALQGQVLVREAMASAAVVVWAAACCPHVATQHVTAALAQGLFLTQEQLAAGYTVQAEPVPFMPSGAAVLDQSCNTQALLDQSCSTQPVLDQSCSSQVDTSPQADGNRQSGSDRQAGSDRQVDGVIATAAGLGSGLECSVVEMGLRARGTSLAQEVARFSHVGRICALKGLVTVIPATAMCWRMCVKQTATTTTSLNDSTIQHTTSGSSNATALLQPGQEFTFLVDGALAFGCQQVKTAPDGHYKFHAACVANACTAQLLAVWQQPPTLSVAGTGSSPADSVCAPPALSQSFTQSVLDMLWGSLDEPLAQVLRQLQGIFDMLLDLIAHQNKQQAPTQTASAADTHQQDGLFEHIARQLLAVPYTRKGRYARLASVVQHIGARKLLLMHPLLVKEALMAMQEDMVSNTASTFLRALLEKLREECVQQPEYAPGYPTHQPQRPACLSNHQEDLEQRSHAVSSRPGSAGSNAAGGGGVSTSDMWSTSEACAAWQSWWLPDLLAILTCDHDKLRTYVSVHALPVVLSLEPSNLITLIKCINTTPKEQQSQQQRNQQQPQQPSNTQQLQQLQLQQPGQEGHHQADVAQQGHAEGTSLQSGPHATAALVSLLRAARQLQLVADLDVLARCKRALGMDVEQVLLAAVVDECESVRVDCFELVATNPKPSEPPGALELKVIARWLACCIRSTSQGLRNRCISIIQKLMARIKVAAAAIQVRAGQSSAGATGGRFAAALKGRNVHAAVGLIRDDEDEDSSTQSAADPAAEARAADAAALTTMQRFCQWTSNTMIGYLYPGAPFERKYLAIEVLNAMLSAWPVTSSPVPTASNPRPQPNPNPKTVGFHPYSESFHSPHVIQLLLANAIDSWDKLRQLSNNVMKAGIPWICAWGIPSTLWGIAVLYCQRPNKHSWVLLQQALWCVRPGVAACGMVDASVSAESIFESIKDQKQHITAAFVTNRTETSKLAASTTLLRLPTPWPGVTTPHSLVPLATWAYQLVCSPRLREADAGARLMKLVFSKYVKELHWHIQLGPCIYITLPPQPTTNMGKTAGKDTNAGLLAAAATFITSLLDLVQSQCELAATDSEGGLLSACRSAFVHGPLLLLRYIVEEVPWSTLALCSTEDVAAITSPSHHDSIQSAASHRDSMNSAASAKAGTLSGSEAWKVLTASSRSGCLNGAEVLKALTARTLSLLEEAVRIASQPLAHPVEGVGAEDVDAGDMDLAGDGGDGDGVYIEGDDAGGCGPDAQVIITGCWLTIKEVALLSGTMAHCIPLIEQDQAQGPAGIPTATPSPSSSSGQLSSGLLDVPQVVRLGQLLVGQVMLVVKHNGAVDKGSMGLTTLAAKLLRSTCRSLSQQPKLLIAEIMRKVISPGQCRDDIVRRSAGIPLAVQALLRAEPANTFKVLLTNSMPQLLAIAERGAPAYWEASPQRTQQPADIDPQQDPAGRQHAAELDSENGSDGDQLEQHQGAAELGLLGAGVQPQQAVQAVQRWPTADASEPWPRVHAFNCLRHLFNDSQLAVDTSGFTAQGVQACISALGDSWWEVRNAATLCFTALVTRVLGFKNPSKGDTSKRAITAAEFFQRFPALHGFLLAQLTAAVQQLESDAASTTTRSHISLPKLHPSLYPILILLSRLRPGPPADSTDSETGPGLSPAFFAPLIQRCCVARHYAVRQLAARALAPLVPSEQILPAVAGLLQQLPGSNSSAAQAALKQAAAVRQSMQQADMVTVSHLGAPSLQPSQQQQLCGNALQGVLMQCEALLQHNVLPGQVQDMLSLVTPCLLSLLAVLSPAPEPGQRPTAPPSAIMLCVLRVCHATLSLMQPSHCHTFHILLSATAAQCKQVIENVHQAQHTDVDFFDPMHSQLCKEAAQIWVGLAAQCQAVVQPHLLLRCSGAQLAKDHTDSDQQDEGATHMQLASNNCQQQDDGWSARLSVCLSSPSQDVRSGAAKAAVQLLAGLHSSLNLPSAGMSVVQRKQAVRPSSERELDLERWSHILHPYSTAGQTTASQAGSSVDLTIAANTANLITANSAQLNAVNSAHLDDVLQSVSQLAWMHLVSERVFKARKRLLRLLQVLHSIACGIQQPANPRAGTTQQAPADESAMQHVHQMQQVLAGAKGVEERAEALRCLGQVLHAAVGSKAGMHVADSSTGQQRAVNTLQDALAAFCDELDDNAQSSQPDDVRLAASDALSASHLLFWAPTATCTAACTADNTVHSSTGGQTDAVQAGADVVLQQAALRCWLVALKLSEDEDERVRSVVSNTMQAAMEEPAQRSSGTLAANGSSSAGPGAAACTVQASGVQGAVALEGARKVHVEGAQRRAFSFIAARFSSLNTLLPAFCNVIAPSSEPLPELLQLLAPKRPAGAGGTAAGEAAAATANMAQNSQQQQQQQQIQGRIFDAELDNQHEEPLFFAQLAAQQLKERLVKDRVSAQHLQTCQQQLERVVLELQAAVHLLQGASSVAGTTLQQAGQQHEGPLVNQAVQHPTVLPYLFRRLLLAWTLHPVLLVGMQEANHQAAAETAMRSTSAQVATHLSAVLQQLHAAGALSGPLACVAGSLVQAVRHLPVDQSTDQSTTLRSNPGGGEASLASLEWQGVTPLFLVHDGSQWQS